VRLSRLYCRSFPDTVSFEVSSLLVSRLAQCRASPLIFYTDFCSSHTNVHSSNRPHYCPVKDCPRGEGGKGFKRKNEMIRHGLVHQSPGYVCPFCPDREHKYPRPDNLQRCVTLQKRTPPTCRRMPELTRWVGTYVFIIQTKTKTIPSCETYLHSVPKVVVVDGDGV